MLIGEPSPWNRDAAALLRRFFDTAVGKLFLAQMAYHRPALSGSETDLNGVAMQAKKVGGYEQALNRIWSLAEPPEEGVGQPAETYPDIEDDSKWSDKQKTS
jgi:hypothetical protein